MPPYTITTGQDGLPKAVSFPCPTCKTVLSAPIEEAGQAQNCPQCREMFKVPGSAEWDAARKIRDSNEAERKRASDEAAEARRRESVAAHQASHERQSKAASRSPRTAALFAFTVFLLIVGGLCLLIALFMGTTVGGVHNIGELNARTNLAIVGSVFFVGAFVLDGISALGREVNRWGNEITDRLDRRS